MLGAFRTQTCSKVLFEDGDRVQGGSDKTFTSKFNFTVYMIHSLCFKIRIMSEFHQGHCHRSMLLHNKAPGPLVQPHLQNLKQCGKLTHMLSNYIGSFSLIYHGDIENFICFFVLCLASRYRYILIFGSSVVYRKINVLLDIFIVI